MSKAEISTDGYKVWKRYSGVYQQQGRMITDRDWNEQSEISKRRLDAVSDHAIADGVPAEGGLLKISMQPDGAGIAAFRPAGGRVYADGVGGDARPILKADGPPGDFSYANQGDFLNRPSLNNTGEVHLYADIWERTVTSLEDAEQMDVALDGADTCFRTQTMAQIKFCPSGDGLDASGQPQPCYEDRGRNPTCGDALLSGLELRSDATVDDLCDPCADIIDLDKETGNYLFRLEVHQVIGGASNPDEVVLKWSSENGAIAYKTGQIPADFGAAGHVFEYYNKITEQHLGNYLDGSNWKPKRGKLRASLDAKPDSLIPGKPFDTVRRWDGVCTLVRNNATDNWSLAAAVADEITRPGRDAGAKLDPALGDTDRGAVRFSGGEVTINLKNLVLSLSIKGRKFVAGDYWLGLVRSAASTEAGRVRVLSGPPVGIKHHYVGLGKFQNGNHLALTEAERRRLSFPPLSGLSADRVCFEDNCERLYEGAENVQQALDSLCDKVGIGQNLRKHNIHLHGWGVVCGLKVSCGEEQSLIKVSDGYALFCDGDGYCHEHEEGHGDIHLNVLELLEAAGLEGKGEFCLSLRKKGEEEFDFCIDPAESRAAINSVFSGTLLGRILETCVDPFRKALSEVTEFGLNELRWGMEKIALKSSRTAMISFGVHQQLRGLYQKLRTGLSSPTDCDLQDDLGDFPAYPFKPGDFRLWPLPFKAKKIVGAIRGNDLLAYDPNWPKLIRVNTKRLEPPEEIELDLTGHTDRKLLGFVDAAYTGSGDLVGFIGRMSGGRKGSNALLMVDMTTLEVSKYLELEKEATGISFNRGDDQTATLILKNPGAVDIDTETGRMGEVILSGLEGAKFATGARGGIAVIEPTKEGAALRFSSAGETVEYSFKNFVPEDLVVYSHKLSAGGFDERVAVSGRKKAGSGQREIRVFRKGKTSGPEESFSVGAGKINLEASGTGRKILLLREREGKSALVSLLSGDRKLTQSWAAGKQLPFEIGKTIGGFGDDDGPIIYNPDRGVIIRPDPPIWADIDIAGSCDKICQANERYLDQVRIAFTRLTQAYIKALRDCICHQFLPVCPEDCGDPPHKVPLACITFSDGRVRDICNIAHRKYAVTLPTMFYWLSLVPVVPFIVSLVRRFCCSDWFGEFSKRSGAAAIEPLSFAVNLASVTKDAKFRDLTDPSQWESHITKLLTGSTGSLIREIGRAQTSVPSDFASDLSGLRGPAAKRRLQELGVARIRRLDIAETGFPTGKFFQAAISPLLLCRDCSVTLYEDKGKVEFYTVDRTSAGSADFALPAGLEGLEAVAGDLAGLSDKKQKISKDIGNLTRRVDRLQKKRRDIDEWLEEDGDRVSAIRDISKLEGVIETLGERSDEVAILLEAPAEKLRFLEEMSRNSRKLGVELEEIRKNLETARAEADEVHEVALNVDTKAAALIAVKNDIADFELRVDTINNSIAKLDELEALSIRVGEISTESEALGDVEGRIAAARSGLLEVSTRVAEVNTAADETLNRRSELEGLNLMIRNSKGNLERFETDAASAEGTLGNLGRLRSELTGKITKLTVDTTDLGVTVKSLEESVGATSRSARETLAKKAELEGLNLLIRNSRDDLEGLESKISSAQGDIRNLTKTRTALTGNIDKLSGQADDLTTKVTALNNSIGAATRAARDNDPVEAVATSLQAERLRALGITTVGAIKRVGISSPAITSGLLNRANRHLTPTLVLGPVLIPPGRLIG